MQSQRNLRIRRLFMSPNKVIANTSLSPKPSASLLRLHSQERIKDAADPFHYLETGEKLRIKPIVLKNCKKFSLQITKPQISLKIPTKSISIQNLSHLPSLQSDQNLNFSPRGIQSVHKHPIERCELKNNGNFSHLQKKVKFKVPKKIDIDLEVSFGEPTNSNCSYKFR